MNTSVSIFAEIPEDLHETLTKYLENHPNLLANLEDYGRNHRLRAWQPEPPQSRKNLSLDNLIDYWSRRQKLRELLCYVGEKPPAN